jgi:OOP family OmpA-OmpF porin
MDPTSGIFRGLCGIAVAAAVAVMLLSGAPVASHASSIGFEITPYAGFAAFDNKLMYKDAVNVGGRMGLYFIPWLGVEGNVGYSPTSVDSGGGADVRFWDFTGDVVFRIMPDKWVVPFLYGGLGAVRTDPQTSGPTETQFAWEAGGGLLFRINEHVGIRLEAKDLMYKSDLIGDDSMLHNIIATGGFTIGFGGAFPDQDQDGVPDNRDRCPDTPLGALVDKDGCPIDSDGDGVPDGIDQCPNTPAGAVVDPQGCPIDSDGDGVPDGVDQCPNTPAGAVVDQVGCPVDSDGDGVPDGLDQCPNTPIGARVDEVGCPIDSDGDGVPDGLDLCPNTPLGAKVDKDGCPIEISELEVIFLDTGLIRLQDVNFETAKANILPESYPRLEEVGNILVQWPQLRIEIGGHADSRGAADYNQGLSERRANSVLEYLVEHFPNINRQQYTTKGYGESEPLVPNTSPENMAKNRRVEFKVLNKDVLEKEVERRRLLREDE